MNRVLLEKELRALQPYLFCILAFFLFSQLFLLATEAPDQQLYDPVKWLEKSRSGTLTVLAFFSLCTGAGLLTQESEQRTLLFLDGLPVSRSRIFAMKVLAAMLVLALLPLLDVTSDIALDWLSRTSTDSPFPWTFLLGEGSLQFVALLYLLALTLLISFTRAWFALVTGLVFLTYAWLRARGVHWLAWLDPSNLFGSTLAKGGKLPVSWPHVAAQLGAAVALLGAAWLAFLSFGDRLQYTVDRLGKLRWLATIGTIIRWLSPIVWITALVWLSGDIAGSLPQNGPPVGEAAFDHYEKTHYEFLYRKAQFDSVKALIFASDQVYTDVSKYLRADPSPSKIVVDLASPVMTHAGAQTNWTKIRMPMHGGMDVDFMKLILGHETAHVFIEQMSNGRASKHFNETRCLHEGLATHVELKLFGTDNDRVRNRREIAGAWSRGKVPLELLFDDKALTRKREPYLCYALGSVFADALMKSGGSDAAARVLHALARKNAPSGLKGAAFWRDTLQAAGLSLDRVAALYDTDCAAALEKEKDFVSSLPRLTATVRRVKGDIVVQPKYEGTAPGTVVCLTESSDPLVPELTALQSHDDGTFTWPAERQSEPVFRYLLGWRTKETRIPIFEPWAEATP